MFQVITRSATVTGSNPRASTDAFQKECNGLLENFDTGVVSVEVKSHQARTAEGEPVVVLVMTAVLQTRQTIQKKAGW